MVIALSSLRVTADFDASGYRAGMAQKVAADEAGAASSSALGAALAKQDVAADNTGGSLGRLSRNYIDGYGSSAKFYGAVANLQRQMELGNVTAERAELIYTGLVAKFGMVASAAEAAAGGNVNLAGVIERVNAVTDTTVVGLTGMGAAFDIARLKAEQAGQVFQSTLNQSFGIGAGGKSARDSASVFEAAAKEADNFAAKAASLRAQIDPLAAAQDKYNAELAEYATLASRGVITSNELAAAQGMAGQKFASAAANIKAGGVAGTFLGAGDAAKLSSFQIQNLSFQMQDVGQAILTGQPLFRTFIQQGSQMAQIFGPGVGVAGAMKALGQGLLQYVTNPINLAFLALAGLAAGVGAFFALVGSGGESAAEALKRHKDLIDEIGKAYAKSSDDVRSFGLIETDVLKATAILNQIQMTNELTKAKKELSYVSTQSLFQIGDPNSFLGGLGMTNPFANWNVPQGFLDDARKFREELRQGSGDVLEYRKHLGELGQAFPTSENNEFIASELKATDAAAKLQEGQRKLQASIRLMAGEATAADRAILGLSAAMEFLQGKGFSQGFTGSARQAETASMAAYNKLLGIGTGESEAERLAKAADQQAKAIQGVKDALILQIDMIGKTAREQAILTELSRAHVTAASAEGREIAALTGRLYDLKNATAAVNAGPGPLTGSPRQAEEGSMLAFRAALGIGTGESEAERQGKKAEEDAKRGASEAKSRQDAIDGVIKSLQFQEDQLGRTAREQEIYNSLNQAGVSINSEAGKAIAELVGHLYDQKEATDDAKNAQADLIRRMDDVRGTAKDTLSTFVGDLREGKSAAEALGDSLGRLSDKLMDMAENSLIDALFGQKGTTGTGLFGILFGALTGGGSSGFTGGMGLSTGGTGGQWHSGGLVGSTSVPRRYIHPAYFDVAPRLHGGLMSDEFPAILQRGERVIPRGGGGGRSTGGSSIAFNQTINVQGSSGDAASDARYIEGLRREMEASARKVIREEMRPRGAFDQF